MSESKRTLTLNVSHTKYSVVRYVSRRLLGWSLTRNDNWDVLWADATIPAHVLASMKPYQRINHFPGMYAIARKSNLCMNLNRMLRVYPSEYNFYPKTWFLPAEKLEVKRDMQTSRNAVYIVKPEASSQGRGIFLVQDPSEIDKLDHSIIQRYISDPLLVDGLKFDLRIYALVTGCSPLRVFVSKEGLARFATEAYKKPTAMNREDVCMHLTNYAVNKKNPKFVSNKDEGADNVGHKWSMSALFANLEMKGVNISQLWDKICDIIVKTLCTIQPSLAHTYRSCQPHDISNAMCFEILGFDILIDSSLTPWLLEVNHSPAFSTGSPLDKKVKRQVIKDALLMLNLSTKDKKNYEAKLKQEIKNRTLMNHSFEQKQRERDCRRAEYQALRDSMDEKIANGFVRVKTDGIYEAFMDTAKDIWEEMTGTRGRRHLQSRRDSNRQEDTKSHRKIKTASEKKRTITPVLSEEKSKQKFYFSKIQ